MFIRLCNLSNSNSFFLFGARGTGKSTLLESIFSKNNPKYWWIDLLNLDIELEYKARPQLLVKRFLAFDNRPEWIIIDEVQKVPQILDAVHQLIESNHNVKFALTGSSARKLKRAEANMLAGRAFNFSLFPFSTFELKDKFDLNTCLTWGTLPQLFNDKLVLKEDKKRFLKSYVLTYLKEEILLEQIIRKIEPFQRFLEVAAQVNGEILNHSKVAREANINSKSSQRYFEILVDTLMGFFLPAYHKSIRKQQLSAAKFYFFDTGVVRAIRGLLNIDISEQTYEFGKLFESFLIMEIYKLNAYFECDYKLSYLKTREGQEIDLIIEVPGKETILIEIKSREVYDSQDVKHLKTLIPSFKNSKGLVLCKNKMPVQLSENIVAVFWRDGLKEIFNLK